MKSFLLRDKIEIMSAGVKIFDLLPGSSRPRGPPCGEPELNNGFHFWSFKNLFHVMSVLSSANKEVKYIIIGVA